MKAKHTAARDLDFEVIGNGWKRATVRLLAGETAWNPASTKTVLWGPGDVTYMLAPSGSIKAEANVASVG